MEPIPAFKRLNPETSLGELARIYPHYMFNQGFSENTVKSFLGDLRLLTKYLGASAKIGKIGIKDLNDFLTWLLHYRGVPCSPKSYARRVTTLKNLFGWLHQSKIISQDPSTAVVQMRFISPLPLYLNDEQVDALLKTTEGILNKDKGDARPHLLVALILQTGIKKSECMNLALEDIDRSAAENAQIFIRYSNPKMAHKERRLSFASDLLPALARYLQQYHPIVNLFECTPRNLEYVLADVARKAGLSEGVSFEMLRWTCAMRDFRDGMKDEQLRQKLGLSKITWVEVKDKLQKLAYPII